MLLSLLGSEGLQGFFVWSTPGKVLLRLWLVQGERFMIWLIIYGKAGILVVLFFNLGNVSELSGEGCVFCDDPPLLSSLFSSFYSTTEWEQGWSKLASLLSTSLYLSDGGSRVRCLFYCGHWHVWVWNEACIWSGGMIRYRVVFAEGMGWPVFSFCKLAISEDICPSRIYDISPSIPVSSVDNVTCLMSHGTGPRHSANGQPHTPR